MTAKLRFKLVLSLVKRQHHLPDVVVPAVHTWINHNTQTLLVQLKDKTFDTMELLVRTADLAVILFAYHQRPSQSYDRIPTDLGLTFAVAALRLCVTEGSSNPDPLVSVLRWLEVAIAAFPAEKFPPELIEPKQATEGEQDKGIEVWNELLKLLYTAMEREGQVPTRSSNQAQLSFHMLLAPLLYQVCISVW